MVRAASSTYPVPAAQHARAASWAARLLDRAYGRAQRRPRIKVLVNPFGGQGRAARYYERDIAPILAAAGCTPSVEQTQHRGHAAEIAARLDAGAWDVVACASGDGLPHEVFNGLGRRADAAAALAALAVANLPCGTGNALSWNLNGTDSPSVAALRVVKGVRTPLDLASVTQGGTRTLSFLSQAVGIVAEVDLGTEHLRWMGETRFTFGFLTRLLRKTLYPCDLAVKVEVGDKAAIRERYRTQVRERSELEERRQNQDAKHPPQDAGEEGLPPLKYGTVEDELPKDWTMVRYDNLGNFYCGLLFYMAADMPFFPAALPSDGCMDLVTIDGDISLAKSLKMLVDVPKNTLFDNPLVRYQKVSGFRIIPRGRPSPIDIDGEHFPFQPFQAEVHPGLGTVLSRSGHSFEGPGLPGI